MMNMVTKLMMKMKHTTITRRMMITKLMKNIWNMIWMN